MGMKTILVCQFVSNSLLCSLSILIILCPTTLTSISHYQWLEKEYDWSPKKHFHIGVLFFNLNQKGSCLEKEWIYITFTILCHLQKIFFTSKSCYLLISNPTHKTKTRMANRWGGTINIANHLNQSIWWADKKETLSSTQIIFITLFFFTGKQSGFFAFYQPLQTFQFGWVKTNLLS